MIWLLQEYNGTNDDVITFNYPAQNDTEALRNYVYNRTGPYAQYGPVMAAHYKANTSTSAHPNIEVEIFLFVYNYKKLRIFFDMWNWGKCQDIEFYQTKYMLKIRWNFQIFVNPNGPGGDNTSDIYNTPNAFQSVLMLLDPVSNDVLQLDDDNNVKYPNIYLSAEEDVDVMVDGLYTMLNEVFFWAIFFYI